MSTSGFIMACHYGEDCKKKDCCKYSHDTICFPAWCKFGFDCYNKTTTCKFKHAPGGTTCKYGTECTQKDKNCPFDHSGKVVKKSTTFIPKNSKDKKDNKNDNKNVQKKDKNVKSENVSSQVSTNIDKAQNDTKPTVWNNLSNSKVKNPVATPKPAAEAVHNTVPVCGPGPIPFHMLENQIEQEKKILELLKLQDERFELERALQDKHMRRYMESYHQHDNLQGGLTSEELAFQEQMFQEQEQEQEQMHQNPVVNV